MNWRRARADLAADAIRGHRRIEALHWIRDVMFGEDLSQIRTGSGSAVMATLRNAAVSRHRLDGADSTAQACRHTPDTPSAHWRYSHNCAINYAGALGPRRLERPMSANAGSDAVG